MKTEAIGTPQASDRGKAVSLECVLRRHWCKRLYSLECNGDEMTVYRCNRILVIVHRAGGVTRVIMTEAKWLVNKHYSPNNHEAMEYVVRFVDDILRARKGVLV